VADRAVEGLLTENAGGALAKIFKTGGEPRASSVTVRVVCFLVGEPKTS